MPSVAAVVPFEVDVRPPFSRILSDVEEEEELEHVELVWTKSLSEGLRLAEVAAEAEIEDEEVIGLRTSLWSRLTCRSNSKDVA